MNKITRNILVVAGVIGFIMGTLIIIFSIIESRFASAYLASFLLIISLLFLTSAFNN